MRRIVIGVVFVVSTLAWACSRQPTAAEREQQERQRQQDLTMEKLLNAAEKYDIDGAIWAPPQPPSSGEGSSANHGPPPSRGAPDAAPTKGR